MRILKFLGNYIVIALMIFLPETFPQNNSKLEKILDYCSIFDSDKYDEKTVTSKALLYISVNNESVVDGDLDYLLFSDKCNIKDYFAKVKISKSDIEKLNKKGLKIRNKKFPQIYEVIFEGKLSVSFIPAFGHLNWLRAEIEIDAIKSAKFLQTKHFPNFEAFAPIFSTGNSLKYTNSELMFSYFGKGFDNSILHKLSTDNTKLFVNGKIVDANKLIEIILKRDVEKISVQIKDVQKNENKWNVQGIVTMTYTDHSKMVLNYDNEFLFENNESWSLIYSKITNTDIYKTEIINDK